MGGKGYGKLFARSSWPATRRVLKVLTSNSLFDYGRLRMKKTISNPSDSVPHFLKLYEIQKDCFDKRRVTVWRVSVSFWTAIAVGTGFLVQKVQISVCTWWFFALAFVAFCFGWLMRVWYADQIDHMWMYVYRSHAEKALGIAKKALKYGEAFTLEIPN